MRIPSSPSRVRKAALSVRFGRSTAERRHAEGLTRAANATGGNGPSEAGSWTASTNKPESMGGSGLFTFVCFIPACPIADADALFA